MLFLLPAALAWPVDPACDPGPAPRIEPAAWRVYDFDEPTPGCAADFAPSGLDWHPGRAALVIASDEGQYATLKPGEAPTCYDLPGDNEAVAVVGEALIFAREDRALRDRARLVEVALGATAPARAWTLSFPGAGGNDGVEGLAWTGEALAAGDQSVARIQTGCPSAEGACAGPSIETGLKEVAGLHAAGARLYALADKGNDLVAYEGGVEVGRWELPDGSGPGQEGLAIVGCTLFIAADDDDDARRVLAWRFRTP